MKWWQISIILCCYGFFKELRPSEPFISPYLTDFKNFTIEEVNEEIYPVGTYSYLALMIVIFLLTDFLRYKPVLIAGSIAGVITWSILVWGSTLDEMRIVEFFYGFFMGSEVAYFTYIYAKVDKEHYQKVTSHTRAAFLFGRASAGLSSQILIFFHINYLQLNYVTIFSIAMTVILACCLPSVPQSIYFHSKTYNKKSADEEKDLSEISASEIGDNKAVSQKNSVPKLKIVFAHLYKDFKEAFTNLYVLQWSLWWALAYCGYLQVSSYCQLLWQDIIQNESVSLYHGYVEFTSSLLGALAAVGTGYLAVRWNLWGEIFLGILTIIQGGFLFYSAYLNNLYIAYAMYMVYKFLYDAAITIATYEIAKCINEDSYGLVFGINTFTAVVVQSILTAVVIKALGMNIRTQFQIYGGYHFFIGCGFSLYGLLKFIC